MEIEKKISFHSSFISDCRIAIMFPPRCNMVYFIFLILILEQMSVSASFFLLPFVRVGLGLGICSYIELNLKLRENDFIFIICSVFYLLFQIFSIFHSMKPILMEKIKAISRLFFQNHPLFCFFFFSFRIHNLF